MNPNITTNTLDQCIATFKKIDYSTINALILHNGTTNMMANLQLLIVFFPPKYQTLKALLLSVMVSIILIFSLDLLVIF